jgi:hypothetical protein
MIHAATFPTATLMQIPTGGTDSTRAALSGKRAPPPAAHVARVLMERPNRCARLSPYLADLGVWLREGG